MNKLARKFDAAYDSFVGSEFGAACGLVWFCTLICAVLLT